MQRSETVIAKGYGHKRYGSVFVEIEGEKFILWKEESFLLHTSGSAVNRIKRKINP